MRVVLRGRFTPYGLSHLHDKPGHVFVIQCCRKPAVYSFFVYWGHFQESTRECELPWGRRANLAGKTAEAWLGCLQRSAWRGSLVTGHVQQPVLATVPGCSGCCGRRPSRQRQHRECDHRQHKQTAAPASQCPVRQRLPAEPRVQVQSQSHKFLCMPCNVCCTCPRMSLPWELRKALGSFETHAEAGACVT